MPDGMQVGETETTETKWKCCCPGHARTDVVSVEDGHEGLADERLKTLECAGRCLQARRVGGDYYDFLELGPGQVGLLLADISGKGVHAALLMANLQAHLRSLSGATRSAAGQRATREIKMPN